MEYDLIRLFEHPLGFRNCIPSAIVVMGGDEQGECAIQVNWKRRRRARADRVELILKWNVAPIRQRYASLEDEVAIL
jgi:hypothetical protein